MTWLVELLKRYTQDRFTGQLTINFFQGGITNIEERRTYKPPVSQ